MQLRQKVLEMVLLQVQIPTSTVVSIGSDVAVNDNGEPYICYCFSEVAGYSKFGLYRGNGSC